MSSTHVGLDAGSTGFLVGGSVLVCGALSFVVPGLTSWAVGQEWLPAQDLLPTLEDAAHAAPFVVRLGVMLLVGLALGLFLRHASRTIEVADSELWVVEGGKRTRWGRRQVASVSLSGRRISLRDATDAELVEVSLDSPPADVRRELAERGWPLVD
ncbi:hypothetical protein GCM10011519_24460 [Marmoricola endophyticus]|uniref:YqeB PH domain-containing protein n=1 Tax=Marmoricola endophyticus TaxID=2040280 RepID=A0A917F5B7_9ACTN|nr:hypothetical protein [Marmoricola endophyticus]GGF49638.1 hypothetical protein GCM10011519_24460 [Marmoricola endophyticus]